MSKLRSSTKPKSMTWSLTMDCLVTVERGSLSSISTSTSLQCDLENQHRNEDGE